MNGHLTSLLRPANLVLVGAISMACVLGGCEVATVPTDAAPQAPPSPYRETQINENFFRLDLVAVPRDSINPNRMDYADVLRAWIKEHSDKRIVSVLGIPDVNAGNALTAICVRTQSAEDAPPQRVLQMDSPSELPSEFTISTLYFFGGQPAGIIGVTQ